MTASSGRTRLIPRIRQVLGSKERVLWSQSAKPARHICNTLEQVDGGARLRKHPAARRAQVEVTSDFMRDGCCFGAFWAWLEVWGYQLPPPQFPAQSQKQKGIVFFCHRNFYGVASQQPLYTNSSLKLSLLWSCACFRVSKALTWRLFTIPLLKMQHISTVIA
jgi:hypothetical protein